MKKHIFSYLTSLIIGFFLFHACTGSESTDINNNNDTIQVEKTVQVDTSTLNLSTGKEIYSSNCQVCHLEKGEGIPGHFPPLANSDYLLKDKTRALKQAIYGSRVPITVNGIEYPGKKMTIIDLSDEQVKDVVNYVLNSWGNNGGAVTLEDVKAVRTK